MSIYWESSSHLTKSYFSEGGEKPPTKTSMGWFQGHFTGLRPIHFIVPKPYWNEKNNDPKKSTAKLSPCWVAGQLVLQGGAPYLAFSWFISTITRVYGGYIYSYIMGFINQLITGGAPPCRLWQPHEYEKLELYGWAFPAPRRGRVKCCACCCPMIFKGNAGSLNTNPFA